MAKTFLIPEEQRDAILGYLMGRPYKEVALGVQMLQGLREAPAQSPIVGMLRDAQIDLQHERQASGGLGGRLEGPDMATALAEKG